MKLLCLFVVAFTLLNSVAASELEAYVVRGNPTTLGVDFSIGHPEAWKSRGTRPPAASSAVESFWSKPSGLCDSMALVVPQRQNLNKRDVTKKDFEPIFRDPRLEQALAHFVPGGKIVKKVYLPDFQYPAGYLDYTALVRLPDGQHRLKVRNYIVYLRKVMLQVQFYFIEEQGADRFDESRGMMKAVMDSLVLLPRSS